MKPSCLHLTRHPSSIAGLLLALLFGVLALSWGTLRASIAYGSINNFDTVNDTGHECHGFEIELEDCPSTDITYTYNYNHYGVPEITEDNSVPGHPKCIIRWQSKKNADGSWAAYTAIPAGPISPTNGHMFTNPAVNFGGEHFGVGYRMPPTVVRYRWLIDNGAGVLVPGGDVQVSTPTFNYFPPVANNVPQVQAVIVPPPPPAPEPKEFGKPVWVKEIRTTTHNNNEVKLRDLVSDDPADENEKNWKNGEPDEVEVEWQLLQTDYKKNDGGKNNKVPAAAEDLPGGDEVVTRRYEFYKYVGPIDEESGEAMAENVGADDLHGEGVKTINGVEVDLSTVVIVGDYTGAQMSAVDVDAPVGLIDHVGEARANEVFAARTVVIGGSLPFTCTQEGALPAGMTFDEITGVLSGTPTEGGEFNFKVTASDGTNPEVTKNYTLMVAEAGAELPPANLLDTIVEPAGSGTTSGDGAYDIGANATVTAAAAPGFAFVHWTDNGTVVSTNMTHSFMMDVNHTLTAHFVADNSVQITQQPQSQTANPGTNISFNVVATAPGPLTYQWRKNGAAIAGAVGPSLGLPNITEADQADYDVVIIDAIGSRQSAAAHLEVANLAVVIEQLTASKLAGINTLVTLEVTAAGDGVLAYQWYKNDVKISNATARTLVLPAVQLKDAGAYRVEVTGNLTVHSDPVMVGVVDDAARMVPLGVGASVKLEVKCEGEGLTFAWQKDGQPVIPDSRIKGTDQKTLSIQKADAGGSGLYTLVVTGPGGTLTTKGHKLSVFSAAPVIAEDPPQFPAAIVSGDFVYAIPVSADAAQAPTGFAAAGLPPGLKIDMRTGIITGKPTAVAKDPLGYLVKLTAFNSKGRTSVSGRLLVQALPQSAIGEFSGPIGRDEALNSGLGGVINVNILSTGLFSGKLVLGTVTYPFRGVLQADPAGGPPQAAVVIPRKGAGPLGASFGVDVPNNVLVNGQLTDGAATLAFEGWRRVWNAKSSPADVFAGLHTFAMEIPASAAGDVAVPQGSGFGSFTVSSAGTLMLAGKLADGEVLTGSTFVGPLGEIVVFRVLYGAGAKGSVAGRLDIDPPNLGGALTWSRPPNPANGHRLYKAGFPAVVDLSVVGGRYVAPAAPLVFLGLTPGANNATLSFFEGGIEAAQVTAPLSVGIGEKSKASLPANPGVNPRRPTLMLTEKTGAFRGAFTLEDTNPLPPPALPRVIRRTVTFEGVAVSVGGSLRGCGYFLLPQLPAAGAPDTTSTTSAILSGQVLLEAAAAPGP